MFYPTGLRIDLFKLLLGDRTDRASFIKNQRARAGRPLVQSENIFHSLTLLSPEDITAIKVRNQQKKWHGSSVRILPVDFYNRDPVSVAQDLLGKLLFRVAEGVTTAGIIVETEAYLAKDDPANHAYRGCTPRNAAMFGPPGHAYVYCIHTHYCLNVVTEPAGVASAVLLRAIQPTLGIEVMQTRRGNQPVENLASGPGKLCTALAIDRALNHWDLTRGDHLWLEAPPTESPMEIVTTRRVGVTSAHDLRLRFYLAANPFVSRGPKPSK